MTVTASAERDVIAALQEVTVRFGGVVALDSVTMEVCQGEVVALVGPNGAGKTTLLNVLAGVVAPSEGGLHCFDERRTRFSPVAQARLGIARTFQQLSLLREMTVREHVMFGYLASLRSQMRFGGYLLSSARLAGMAKADNSPLAPDALLDRLGLTDVADQLAAEQPVGTARMVDLARALAMRPKLLLLDEPVSGLSDLEARAVAASLAEIRGEHRMAVLIVEHNMDFARIVSDRMIALDFGAVIAEGTPVEVLNSERVRKAYFGMAEAEIAEGHAGDEVSAQ